MMMMIINDYDDNMMIYVNCLNKMRKLREHENKYKVIKKII